MTDTTELQTEDGLRALVRAILERFAAFVLPSLEACSRQVIHNDANDYNVLLDDEGFDWFRDINHALNLIRRSLAPVVIGNADLLYPVKDGGVALAVGSLANMLQPIAQKSFYRFGKPDAMMFVYALQAMRSARPGTKNHKVLMVGDTLQTDILGARMAGLDTVLVLSGNTMPHQAEMLIQSTGIVPTYVCPDILT